MTDRQTWVSRHNPVLRAVDPRSPLTVGNGSFAFTADISGLQTLYDAYAREVPLCCLSDWGWHTAPADIPGGRYTLDALPMDRFDFCGREVRYPVSRFPGSEPAYDWLRQNPHRADLARVGLRLRGEALGISDFAEIRQELDLYSGTLHSAYALRGAPCRVITACDPENDALALQIECDLLTQGLTVDIDLPLGSSDITAADWRQPDRHQTVLVSDMIHCHQDDLRYQIRINAPGARISQTAAHRIRIAADQPTLTLTLAFAREDADARDAEDVFSRSTARWRDFWEKGAMLDLSRAADPRAPELERRIVLSLYLLAVNSSGRMPPAETGLTCNSWYGKAHLEMHFWHMAWAPLWGHGDLLARSLPWYHDHLPQARLNAARNGYRGARWPKMVGCDGVDSPSPIAVLLVWQQPHLLVLLDLLRLAAERNDPASVPGLLREHWPLISETADFMADYAVPDPAGVYHLEPPLIPVQERFDPRDVRDPAFETAYWRFGLGIAIRWAEAMGKTPSRAWREVYAGMALPPVRMGMYAAHATAAEPFGGACCDHPSMLQCFGLLPGDGIDRAAMSRTLDAVLERWDEASLWGWDFAVLAMTAARLGRKEDALNLLLRDSPKNVCMANGHNRQEGIADLPLYLPGNGGWLIACVLLAAGGEAHPGILNREDGWEARWEGGMKWY